MSLPFILQRCCVIFIQLTPSENVLSAFCCCFHNIFPYCGTLLLIYSHIHALTKQVSILVPARFKVLSISDNCNIRILSFNSTQELNECPCVFLWV
jgi:hypothetical protein